MRQRYSAVRVHGPSGEHTADAGAVATSTTTARGCRGICLPAYLPEFIVVDLARLDVGCSIHLSELNMPANVQIIELTHGANHDLPVVSMQAAKVPVE